MKTPKFWYKDKSSLRYIFYPLSALWLIGVYFKKFLTKPQKFKVPVICVGNIISGGSGKTPLTIELAKLFLKKKFVVHVVKKKYKCKNTQDLILINEKSNPLLVGDEPMLISKITTTWLVKDRKIGIEHAIKKGANLIILDDGYQDFSIIKDYNILTINQMQQFGNKSIIPAGPLREKIYSGIQRCDSIFYYGNMDSLDPTVLNSSKPITYAKLLYEKNLLKNVKNKNILAFAGIAHPKNFFISLINYGFNLVKKIEYPDHYRYKKKDFKKIILMSEKFNLTVFTTEKDYVKVPKEFKNKILPIPLIVQFNQDALYNLLIRKIKKNA